eukprot:Skav217052  [mRNA]  locus=scaffold1849:236442:240761:+ [translate_table: standard]
MGDWNQQDGDINSFQVLRDHGWQEIQILARDKHDRPITKTCHGSTTKDFVWISPELIPHWRRTDAASLFPEHHHIWAEFHGIGKQEKVHLWRKPKPLQWDLNLELSDEPWTPPTHLDSQTTLETIATEFERRAAAALQQKDQRFLQQQEGRSKTKEPVQRAPYEAPLKPSRLGHAHPNFHGQHLRHAEWFKQLRRLESVARGDHASAKVVQHKRKERAKILSARGFPQSFATWWRKLGSYLHVAPQKLPQELPSQEVLKAIQLTFEREFRQLEEVLIRECQAIGRRNRVENPNKIFQDIKVPPAAPIALVENSQTAKVQDIDHSEVAIVLDRSFQYDEELPLFVHDKVVFPVHGDNDKLWLESVEGIQIGHTVRQEGFEGSLPKLFELFRVEWEKRWDRHLRVPVTEWEPLVNFFVHNFPPGNPLPYKTITPELWVETLRKKKARAATGPDGWARLDLINMPRPLIVELITLLERVEAGEDWPITAITGLIVSLAKVDNPTCIQQYRPITVFSLIYRTWSSIRAKEVLHHLQQFAPTKCFGNIPMRSATQVWLGIQSELESAKVSGCHVSGAVLDIQKCFNHMPRIPIFEICHHLGVNKSITRGWFSALQKMTRRFVVRGSISPGQQSSTGCAEGCALSVVGMAALNILIDCYLRVRVPQATLWSYVDNLEISSPSVDHTLLGLHHLRQVLHGLDLPIDESKTILWANNASERKTLRDSQHQVVQWARDLGGHVQYSQLPTNKVVTAKILKFKPRWRDFARSLATKDQKVKAIKQAAWPNALHAVSSVNLSKECVREMRTAAMRSLGLEQLGASSLIQLSLLESPLTDPGFYILQRTVLDARYHLSEHESKHILNHLAIPNGKIYPDVGPCSVLLHRLNQVGWHWDEETFVDVAGQACDLWECPLQELTFRLMEAWQSHVLRTVSKRDTFGGMETASVHLTVRKMPKHPCDKGILHRSLNGTFYTADHAKHMEGEQDTKCPFCGHADSQFHRHWECEELSEARVHCTLAMRDKILASSAATYNHGWIQTPPNLSEFRAQLKSIPDTTAWLTVPAEVPPILDLFTDGSCLRPRDPICRLASWGVVLHTPTLPQEFSPVAAGVVPGVVQTIARGELHAAYAALRMADKMGKPFRLWTDNLQVYKTLKRSLDSSRTEAYHVASKVKNHDLVNSVGAIGFLVRHLCIHVIKVCSHQQVQPSTTWVEQWSWLGNEAADHTASHAIHEQPKLLAVWEDLCREVDEAEAMREQLHATLIAVGRMAQEKKLAMKQQKAAEESEPVEAVKRVHSEWIIPADPPDHAKYLRCPDLPALRAWSQTLHDPGQPTRWWTWQQLFVDARLNCPNIGPWNHTNSHTWKEGAVCTETRFAKRCRSFSTYITALFKVCGHALPIQYSRPDSHAYAFWAKTLPVKVSEDRFRAVDQFLLQWGTMRQHKDHNRITELP